MKKNPCYNCIDRFLNCHNNCPKDIDPDGFGYQKWKKLNEKKNKNQREENGYVGYISDLRSKERRDWRK